MGLVVRSRCQVEKEVVDFLTNLLQGYHCTPDLLGASPFKPDFTYLKYFLKGVGQLTPEQAKTLTKKFSLSEECT